MAIRSESRFIWKFILQIIISPITFLLVILKKKTFSDLFQPFKDLISFIFEPRATIIIIILNIICFAAELFTPEKTLAAFFSRPTDLFSTHAYTLITSGFLHASVIHLFGNMLALFIFGRVVEKNLGSMKFILIYLGALIISGIFSSLIHLFLIYDNTAGLGASGAIMGIIAAAILIEPFYLTYELILPLPVMFVGWLTIAADITGILNPVEDGIGHFAHLGGFLSIAILLYLLEKEDRKKITKGFVINVVSLIVIAAAYFFLYRYV